VAILIHADPDSIASAFALKKLFLAQSEKGECRSNKQDRAGRKPCIHQPAEP
jgi:hypothetical protein